jgi:DNA-binding HxlR family transcriptional regulator
VERTSFSAWNCSVAQCLEIVGEWWSMLIVRDAFMGVRRFDDFQRDLGISRNILNQRLSHLVEFGVLSKVPYCERPVRYEYRLTKKGRDLWPVLTAIRQWGDTYQAPDGPPVELIHKRCGHRSTAVLHCSVCNAPIEAGDMKVVAGPGYKGDSDLPVLQGSTRS